MLECCFLELPSCKLPFHYFVEANFTASICQLISSAHSAKSALLGSTVTALRRPSSSGLIFFVYF